MESSYVAVSFCIRFTHLELFLARVFISCAPIVGVLSFLLLVLHQCFSERGILDMLPFAGFLFTCWLLLFSPQWGACSSLSLMGVWGLSNGCSGEFWVSVHWGGWSDRPPSTSRIADCLSVENLGLALEQERCDSLHRGAVWSAGLLCTLEKQGFWCHLQSSTLYLSSTQWGISHSCSLMGEWRLSCCQDSGEFWASVLYGEGSQLAPAE
jgi:hypothetical protein